jgi:hypothetical protein
MRLDLSESRTFRCAMNKYRTDILANKQRILFASSSRPNEAMSNRMMEKPRTSAQYLQRSRASSSPQTDSKNVFRRFATALRRSLKKWLRPMAVADIRNTTLEIGFGFSLFQMVLSDELQIFSRLQIAHLGLREIQTRRPCQISWWEN